MPTHNKLELCAIFLFESFFADILYHFGNAIIILIARFVAEQITQNEAPFLEMIGEISGAGSESCRGF